VGELTGMQHHEVPVFCARHIDLLAIADQGKAGWGGVQQGGTEQGRVRQCGAVSSSRAVGCGGSCVGYDVAGALPSNRI